MFTGIFIVAIILLIVALVCLAIALFRLWLRDLQIQRDRDLERREKFRPDGKPYPPADRGICDCCSQLNEKVYYIQSGQRLCPDCYHNMLEDQKNLPR